jgi:polyisoprenoid-binding protein YceI
MRTMKTLLNIGICITMALVVTACQDPAKNVPKADTKDATTTTPAPTEKAAEPAVTPPAEPAPAPATTTPAPEPAPAAAAGPVSYKLDANSSIGFIGSNLIGQREGGFSNFDGTVIVDGGNIETAKIDITIDMKSVSSDSDVLTGKLKGEKGFFETEQFPTSTFKSTTVAKQGDGYTVTGVLNLHGIEKEISFPATISADGKTLTAKAEFAINRQDWKITYEGTGDFAVRDDVVIKLDINAAAS